MQGGGWDGRADRSGQVLVMPGEGEGGIPQPIAGALSATGVAVVVARSRGKL